MIDRENVVKALIMKHKLFKGWRFLNKKPDLLYYALYLWSFRRHVHYQKEMRDKLLTPEDYKEIKSLHNWKEWEHNEELTWGEWVKPVWPSNRCLQGSPPTPYIFDDRCRWDDVGEKILEWYDMSEDERRECGQKGIEFVNDSEIMMSGKMMSQNFIDQMDTGFEKWTPRKRYSIFKA